MRSFRDTKSFSLVKNFLLATSLVTLAVIVPLNTLIIAHPHEPVCLSCLVTIYAGLITCITLWLFLGQRVWGGRLYSASLKALTVAALVPFLHAIQITTIPSAWNTIYAIICLLGLLALVLAFIRGQKEIVTLLLMFALILSLYEAVNLARIVAQARRLAALGPTIVEPHQPRHVTKNSPHVFLIVFDEFSLIQVLKGDFLDRDMVPYLAEFAGTATWYRQAVTLYGGTEYAMTSLLAGRSQVGRFREEFLEQSSDLHLFNAASRTHDVYVNGIYLPYCRAFGTFIKGCMSHMKGFSNYGILFRNWWDRAVPGVIRGTYVMRVVRDSMAELFLPAIIQHSDSFKEALRLGQDFSRPTFTFIHVGLPHHPYVFRANGDIRWDDSDYYMFAKMTKEQLLRSQNHYREQITYTDRLFGEFMSQLKELNLYDRALIVVTSDHGISFDPAHPGREKTPRSQGVSRVPLLIRLPGQREGRINDRPVSISDISPTLLRALSLDREDWRGVFLFEQ